jgi:hypothetical protein
VVGLAARGRRGGAVVVGRGLKGRSRMEEGCWAGEGGCSMMEEGRLIVLAGRESVLRL